MNQLKDPDGIYVDSYGNIYIADAGSMRIVKWEPGASQGVVAGETNNQGDDDDELNHQKISLLILRKYLYIGHI